jgi:PAS domain S-box-containing protein
MEELMPGNHIGSLYETEEEYRTVLTSFLRQGLERGERVLCIVDAHPAETVRRNLRDSGLEDEPYLGSGQLSLLTAADASMQEGVYDSDRMIALLRTETERALADGYPALRIAEEMTWAVRGRPDAEQLMEYERKLDEFLPGSRCLAICQYDRHRFDPAVLIDVLSLHPIVMVGSEVYENCHYLPPAVSPSGPAARLQLWTRMVAERQRAQMALQQLVEQYRAMFVHAVEGIFQSTPDGRILSANPTLARMMGFASPEELIAATTDIARQLHVHPQRRAEFRRLLDERGIVQGFEMEILRQGGSRIWVSASARAVYDAQGKVRYYEGIMEDITARKQAEDALRKFAHVVEQSGDTVTITKPDGIIEYVNPAFEQLTGYTRGEAVGKKPSILKSGKHDRQFYAELWRTILSGGVFRAEFTNRKKSGELFHAEETITPITDAQGVITHFVSIGRDITSRVQADEQLRRSREQLRALAAHLQSVREEERRRIAREVHDELGQVLTGMKYDLAWLARGLPEDSTDLQEKTRGLLALVDETIHTVRRIFTELRPSVLDELGLVAAIEWQGQEFQSRTGIACRVSTGLTDLSLDSQASTALFRICQESLTNVARHAQATRVTVRLSAEQDRLILSVEDNGKGITEQEQTRVTSFGLLGMQERAFLLGGELSVVGRPGAGTTVTVRIPLSTS